jgi:hypothetical protein
MNSRRRLSEQSHHPCVGGISSRQFDIESELVRRDAFEHQLAGVSKLTLVAFQGDGQQPKTHDDRQQHGDGQRHRQPAARRIKARAVLLPIHSLQRLCVSLLPFGCIVQKQEWMNAFVGNSYHVPFRLSERARSVKASASERRSPEAQPLARAWAGVEPSACRR